MIVAVLTASGSCSDAKPRAGSSKQAAVSPGLVPGAEQAAGDSIRVDVYVDATVSMTGFTVGGASNYSKFLEDLESSLSNGWKRVDVHFWKFGGTSREIPRLEFLTARSPAFYGERGMNEVTSIDRVVECTHGPTMRVVITDLFQQAGDVNAIVARIKQECLAEGVAVGVLAIKSQFDGKVYDARVPGYPYRAVGPDTAAYRAFYALVFGQPQQFDRLVQSFGRLPFVSASNFGLISPVIMQKADVVMSKDRSAKDINMNQATGPNAFNFVVRKGAAPGTIIADLTLTPTIASPPVKFQRAELVAYKGATAGGPPSGDFTLKKVTPASTPQGIKMRAEIDFSSADPPGKYIYRLELRTAAVNGFEVPAFVRALSSDDPGPSKDPNKTLNLDRFFMDLRQAASSIQQPVIASWTVSIIKH